MYTDVGHSRGTADVGPGTTRCFEETVPSLDDLLSSIGYHFRPAATADAGQGLTEPEGLAPVLVLPIADPRIPWRPVAHLTAGLSPVLLIALPFSFLAAGPYDASASDAPDLRAFQALRPGMGADTVRDRVGLP